MTPFTESTPTSAHTHEELPLEETYTVEREHKEESYFMFDVSHINLVE